MPVFEFSPVETLFLQGLAVIVAVCVIVPAFRRIGLGSILGYLAAGVVVQLLDPLGVAASPGQLLAFAEFGVTLFLFVIGLELRPSELWRMRGDITRLGVSQMVGSGLVLAAAGYAFGLTLPQAAVMGFGLALSSTAIAMRTLEDTRERETPTGRKTFAILLLQDIAIVPLLLMVSLLAADGEPLTGREMAVQAGVAAASLTALLLGGRLLLNPLFRVVAGANTPELMTATALGVVIGAATLADLAGMSYAMGAFIAGVMLSESAFRHEVQADIEPFRGLFLGLFFVAVGLALDLGAVAAAWPVILVAAPVLTLLKALAIALTCLAVGEDRRTSVRIALIIAQFGEFAFVMFAAASAGGVLDAELSATLIAIVTASMALSPLLLRLEPLILRQRAAAPEESYEDAAGRTLIVGFGRFGQVVSQALFAAGRDVTILDKDPEQIQTAARFGFRVHFGDGARRDVLRAAGGDGFDLVLVCVDDPDAARAIHACARDQFPEARLIVRAYDRRHAIELIRDGAGAVVRETFESAMRMGGEALDALGVAPEARAAIVADVRERDLARLRDQAGGEEMAGAHRLHVQAVRPEPLPRREPGDPPAAGEDAPPEDRAAGGG